MPKDNETGIEIAKKS